MPEKKANKLANSSSPYLRQHAYNPVQWQPWTTEALSEAKERDVPIILSIGYSSCHWCHVMEKESFENEELAEIMNQHFVCIKVDREERPDIDQIYMDAVQSMGLQGGWPLNVFLTPEQKPFYGGTYFPPAQWRQICQGVAKSFEVNREQINESAEQFFQDLNHSELKRYGIEPIDKKPDVKILQKMLGSISNKFDPVYGGLNKAPKFPMPNIWKFILYANTIVKYDDVTVQLELTLDKMAMGGIYDQIGGGFARYSVDERWFAPHFEKMLYDNGQLLSLYSEAYRTYPKKLYKEIVFDTISFIERELTNQEGGFYSALDADSEGVEGKFYTWTADELQELLGSDYSLFSKYFQLRPEGNWEEGRNILHCEGNVQSFANENNIPLDELERKIAHWKEYLLEVRSKRIRPGLDDKILAGWNGLVLKGLTDAYRTFQDPHHLDLAIKNAEFIAKYLMENGELLRLQTSESNVVKHGFLEDYAFVIDGFIGLYQCNFDDRWLVLAKQLLDKAIDLFYDSKEELFYYTPINGEQLIARKKEIFDNVIPASNSQMGINLYLMSKFFYEDQYEQYANKMLNKLKKIVENDVSYLSNWAILYFYQTFETAEISFVGKNIQNLAREFDQQRIFNMVMSGMKQASDIPMIQNRERKEEKDTIYVCYNKSCKLPVHTVEEAIKQIDFEPGRP